MGMTATEKIIAVHSDRKEVKPGESVFARVDLCLGNDVTAPLAIEIFEREGFTGVWDPTRICLVQDHFQPSKDIRAAELAKTMRRFAAKHSIEHYYDVGRGGIEHALLPEQGLVLPGELVVGADSHTCTYGALGAFSTGVGSTDLAACFATGRVWLRVPQTVRFTYRGKLQPFVGGKDLILYTIGKTGVSGALYKAMEFAGEVIEKLEMDDRFSMCNMAIEAGAKSGIVATDAETEKYLKGRAKRKYVPQHNDEDADYAEVIEFDVSGMGPQVSVPSLPENATPVEELSDVTIDQVVIGSCTNGRISDLREAAEILRGRRVHSSVRLIVIPATQDILLQAMKEGIAQVFVEAGAALSTPTCGPCLGGHMGVLGGGERALATTNRNFSQRMGHASSEVYLCGPAVAAASAVTGRITHPARLATPASPRHRQ